MRLFKKSALIFFLVLYLVVSAALPGSATAFSSGGSGVLTILPTSIIVVSGISTSFDVMFNSGGQAISGIAMRLLIPVTADDLEVTAVTPNSTLGWSFPVSSHQTEGSNIQVDVMGLITSVSGYTPLTNTKLATITVQSSKIFTPKNLSFSAPQTKMTRKSDAADIQGTLGTATLNSEQSGMEQIAASPGLGSFNVSSPQPSPLTNPANATPSNAYNGTSTPESSSNPNSVSIATESNQVISPPQNEPVNANNLPAKPLLSVVSPQLIVLSFLSILGIAVAALLLKR